MKYPTYDKYKDSGTPWLGKIPLDWSKVRLKRGLSIQNGRDYKEVEADKGYPVIGSGGQFSFATDYLYDGEAVLLGRKGTIDKPLYITGRFWTVDTMYYGIPLKNNCGRYLYYCATQIPFGLYSTDTALPSMTQTALGNHFIAAPSFSEQKAIAQFLDEKTKDINALISKKENLLKLLAEQRTALVTKAVTKGIKLNTPMKDSKIGWLGHVPKHWSLKRLRFSITTNPKKSNITADLSTLVSFVPMDAVGEYGGLRLDVEKPMDEVKDGYTYFANNDVVVAKITPCFENGKGALAIGLTNGIAFGTTELHVLRSLPEIDPRYLFLLTTTYPFRKNGESEMFGAGGQKRISETFIKDFRIGVPPLDEQSAILEYVDKQLEHIDTVTERVTKVVDHLREYRTSLITNAVTGKIKVI